MIQGIAAVVVLYEPTPIVKYNISSYIEDIECLYIIDNSHQFNDILFELSNHKIKILHQGYNIGISKALNLALKEAKKDKFKWLLTFDQDTYFEKKIYCKKFLLGLDKLNYSNIAIVSPLHNKNLLNQNTTIYKNVDFVMTSANAVNVDIAHKVNGFDENLFIDEVDHEFCLKVRLHGYDILIHNYIFVKHSLGVPHKFFSKIKIYPKIRLYYMSRNYLYLRSKYRKYNVQFFKQRDKYLIKFFIKQIIFGYNKLANIRYIVKGINDYYNFKFGKLIIDE